MRVVIFTLEGLRYDHVSILNPKLSNKTYVINSLIKQGICFHNFRLASPIADNNIRFLQKDLASKIELDIYYCDGGLSEMIDHFSDQSSDCQFVLWKHIRMSGGKNKDSNLLKSQEQLRMAIEWLDQNKYIEDTAIILLGVSGFSKGEDHVKKVFLDKEISLYDEYIHVPLVIYYPKCTPLDVANSVSSGMISDGVKNLLNDSMVSGGLVGLCNGNTSIREDIYSRHEDTYGLRGPMFQYYCKVDENKQVMHQELYDLNNDLAMKNDMLVDPSKLSGQLIDLINMYRKRILDAI